MTAKRRSDVWVPVLTALADALAIEAAFVIAYWVRFRTAFFDGFGFIMDEAPPLSAYLAGSVFVILVWLAIFRSRQMYRARRNVNLSDEMFNVIRVITFGMLIVMSAAFFYRAFSYSRIVFGLVWALSIAGILTGRAAMLWAERRSYRKGRYLQPAIIIGNGSLAEEVYGRLHRHGSFGFNIAGYFAETPAGAGTRLATAPCLGTVAEAPAFIRENGISLAFIALASRDQPKLFALVSECEGVNIEFMLVPDMLDVLTSQVRVRDLEGIPFLRVKTIPLGAFGRTVKRAFDLLVAGTILLVLSPLLLLIALAIRLSSPGPILFRQQRIGLDGTEFAMLKFRSMVPGSENFDAQAGLGIRNDPRRTRIGKMLRRFSLDELPQLWNVVRGDMSLVGPRPERTHIVREFGQSVPRYLDRHRVKTGVTGWAQVNGLRGDTSIEERIKYDLYYIENWSVAFDLRILMRTVRATLTFKEQE
jgi:Undecaprenyl-phosphate glucose phosphotransferase